MNNDSVTIKKRFMDLSALAKRRRNDTFTGFLNEAEFSDLLSMKTEIPPDFYTAFGGYEGATRVMVRFHGEDEGVEDFPLAILKVSPAQKKFAEALSHRDFLGAILNLGIERSEIGDIVVGDKEAYIVCTEKMADYVAENLSRIKHTAVKTGRESGVPEGLEPVLREESVLAASERLDLVISKICKLSRNECSSFFLEKKVFLNGRCMENHSYKLREGDVVSVRGFGKFVYDGIGKTTKKGNLMIHYRRYV